MVDIAENTNDVDRHNSKTTSNIKSSDKKAFDGVGISIEEHQHRQDAWNDAVANFALEGIYPSEEMKRIGQLYIDGEITLEQHGELMRKAILDGIA